MTGDWFDGDWTAPSRSKPEESATDDRHVRNTERPGRALRRVVTSGAVAD